MKLLLIKFENTVDLSALPFDTEVTVAHDATSVTGKVVTPVGPMPDPPALEGVYHIAPVPPPTPEQP